MIWATAQEVRDVFAEQLATGDTDWTGLPESDDAVDTLIASASRALGVMVIRWPVLDDADRAEDTEQRGHIVQAVAETIRARLNAAADRAALGGRAATAVVAGGGRVKAGTLEVQGGPGGALGHRSRPPVEAWFALQSAGLLGGSVATW